jgi:4-amino-4-deoxychorismate lyase
MKALVNGHAASDLALNDRGLLYGDGLFETIAVLDGRPREFERHLRRLLNGCQQLAIAPPDKATLIEEVGDICLGVDRAVLKLIVTRGPGGRGYRPVVQGHSTRILLLDAWPGYPSEYRTRGIDATCCRTRLGRNARLAGLKHLNRLEQVIARGEWQDEFQEGLMLDTEDQVIEGTMSNVFAVCKDSLHTPEITYAGVAGIMRERILECAARRCIAVHVHPMSLNEIRAADGLFFCNSLIGIWPVRRLDDRRFDDQPLSSRFMELLEL